METKKCSRCKDDLSLSLFFRHSKNKDGLQSICKTCSAEAKRKGDQTREQAHNEIYPEQGFKICSLCTEKKPLNEFNKRGGQRGEQYKSKCKTCQSIQFRIWRNRKHEKPEEYNKQVALNNYLEIRYPMPGMVRCTKCNTIKQESEFPSNGKSGRRYCYECRNKEQAEYYKKEKNKFTEYRKKFRESNLEIVRQWARMGAQRRRSRKANVECTLTNAEWMDILAIHKNQCACCKTEENLTIDHIVPIAKGGTHTKDNVQPLCRSCNSSKHTKTIRFENK